jgi:ectoine hydroxylase-related dioxygenase (phytanoyl-CoA dioxygenase family)
MQITVDEQKAGQLSPERLAKALRAFRDVGFVVLENVLKRDFIAKVRAGYDVELEKYLAVRGGMDGLEGKTFGKNHIGFFPALFAPIADARIAAHPVAVQIMTELLGPNLHCSFYHTNTAYPGSGYQPIHRDTAPLFYRHEMNVPHPVTALVLNVPLCDFTEENGSTEVWPGTHLIVDDGPEDGKELEERAAQLASVRTNVPVGSLILRDLRTWHRGMPNDAAHPRTMLAIVYQRAGFPAKPTTIPESTWKAWPETARHIFRNNKVVPDAEHQPQTW